MTVESTLTNFSIILAGGSGTRLWPLSRKLNPKQFLAIEGEFSLLQKTAKRLLKFIDAKNIYTVTHKDHAKMAVEDYKTIDSQLAKNVMAEPVAQNTLPAISWAVAVIHKQTPKAVISVFPSDHVIADHKSFIHSVELAHKVAGQGFVTLFGIEPDHPSIEYGYIQSESKVVKPELSGVSTQTKLIPDGCKKVKRFVEKPNLETATKYLDSGGYYWNSGMFVFRADTYMSLLKKHQPKVFEVAVKLAKKDTLGADKSMYKEFPSVSIDYGLMEHLNEAVVIPVSMGWNDLGSFKAVYDYLDKDPKGNVLKGHSEILESQNNLVWNKSSSNLVALFGVNDLVVIQTDKATLICPRDRAGEIKKLVNLIKEKDSSLG